MPRHKVLEIQDEAWNWHKNMVGLNHLMGSLLYTSDNWIYNNTTDKNRLKNLHRFPSTQKR